MRKALFALFILLSIMLLPVASSAQNVTFAASSDAVAIHYNGSWNAATHVKQSLDFLDFGVDKTNHLFLEGHQLLAGATAGFDFYGGGVAVQPSLSFLKNTNVKSDSLAVRFHVAAGNTLFSNGTSHVGLMVGGGADYKLTDSLTWNSVQASYMNIAGAHVAVISSGLKYVFVK